MKKTVLITGAAGFLGSHLCDYFLSKNFKVLGIDNLITGNLKNLSHLELNSDFEFRNIDITHDFKIDDSIDYTLHFASPASPIDYLQIPLETLRVGSLGTENILKLTLKNNARILIASTSEVYGNPKVSPQSETYWGNVNPNGPRSMYDEAKRFSEAAVSSYNRIYNLNTRIVRLFNTYGPKMKIDDGRVVTNFIFQALNGKDITIYGNGDQTRSFCYIEDTLSGIIKAMDSESSEVFNIGNPNEITVKKLAEIIIELTNSNSSLKFLELPADDPMQRKPDISKAKEFLKWSPTTPLEEGLIKTIDWVKNSIN